MAEIKIPRTRSGKHTFGLIKDTAEKLFYEKGYHGTTVGDITKAAGIAAGTFYLYFPNKLELYKYMLLGYHHEIRMTISKKVAKIEGRVEREKEGIKTFLKFSIENPHSFNIIWESLYIDKTLFYDYFDNFAKRYEVGLQQSIEDGEMYDVDTEIVSYILMGISNFFGLKVLLNMGHNNEDIDEMVDKIMDILMTGIFKK